MLQGGLVCVGLCVYVGEGKFMCVKVTSLQLCVCVCILMCLYVCVALCKQYLGGLNGKGFLIVPCTLGASHLHDMSLYTLTFSLI